MGRKRNSDLVQPTCPVCGKPFFVVVGLRRDKTKECHCIDASVPAETLLADYVAKFGAQDKSLKLA